MSTKDHPDVDDSDLAPETHQTIPLKDAPPHAEAHAPNRARTTSEPDSSAPPHPSERDPRTKPELELVSPQRPMGNAVENGTTRDASADPPHPTSPPAAAAAAASDANPAPTGNARNAVANSSPTAPSGNDNAAGQARLVGNGVPTHAQGPPPPHHAKPTTPEPLWAIREVLFAQGDGTLGAALKVCVVGTPDGGLGVVISWGRSAVDEEFGKEFVVEFADAVRELVVGGGGGEEQAESESQQHE